MKLVKCFSNKEKKIEEYFSDHFTLFFQLAKVAVHVVCDSFHL